MKLIRKREVGVLEEEERRRFATSSSNLKGVLRCRLSLAMCQRFVRLERGESYPYGRTGLSLSAMPVSHISDVTWWCRSGDYFQHDSLPSSTLPSDVMQEHWWLKKGTGRSLAELGLARNTGTNRPQTFWKPVYKASATTTMKYSITFNFFAWA